MADCKKTPLQTFQSAVVAGAAKAIAKEMTPDAMQACAQEILKITLKDLTESYGPVRTEVRDTAQKIMQEYVKTPAVQAQIRLAAEAGVNAALETLSEDVRKKVLALAIEGMGSKIASAGRY